MPELDKSKVDTFIYFHRLTTVVFLYSTHTNLAAIAVLNMDDAGEYSQAIAMAIVISVTCIGARIVHLLLTRGIHRRTQAWKAS